MAIAMTEGIQLLLVEYHQTLERVFQENDIPVLDLYPYFRGKKTQELIIHPVDSHPNEKVRQIIAEAFSPFLLEQIQSLSASHPTSHEPPR